MMRTCLAFGVVAVFGASASAHFLWIEAKQKEGKTTYVAGFGEPGEWDASLNGKIKDAKYWVKAGGKESPAAATLDEKEGVFRLDATGSPTSIVGSVQYGVVSLAKNPPTLLRYTSKHLVGAASNWASEKPSPNLRIEALAKLDGDSLRITVLFGGKPYVGGVVKTIAPGDKKEQIKTDSAGVARWKLAGPGSYAFYVGHTDATPGKLDGKEYKTEKDYTAVTLSLTAGDLSGARAVAHLPRLPEAVTSFGAAVADGWLYVYSGHTGGTHEHSRENLSKAFRRVNMANPTRWEDLPAGPALQGVTLTAWRKDVVRVGGVAAVNAATEKEDMRSTAEVARFDAAAKKWIPLPPLPAPRSSHDAAVIGDSIYVVGGWNLQGAKKTWLPEVLRLNLASASPTWEVIGATPFKRRALAVAAHDGDLYILGGLAEDRKISSAVAVFDPNSNRWTEGPALPKAKMLGFGGSATSVNGRLYFTGLADDLYQLDGSAWRPVAKLGTPRFMHRLLAGSPRELLAVAGSSRDGHVDDVESIRID